MEGIDILQLIHWDTVVTGLMSASIIWLIKKGEQKRDEARKEAEASHAAEAEWRATIESTLDKQADDLKVIADDRDNWVTWRAEIEARLDGQDDKIASILKGQCTQMRSDLIHRAHRYIDDLGCASTDEKNAFDEEYKDYCELCEAYGIKNNFVDHLAQQVMELPGRSA